MSDVQIGDIIESVDGCGIEPFRVTELRPCDSEIGVIGQYLHIPDWPAQKKQFKIYVRDVRSGRYRVRKSAHEQQLQQLRDVQALANCKCDGGRAAVVPLGDLQRAKALVTEALQRGNDLADRAGTLHDENRELLVENAKLRRELEMLRRRGQRL